MPDPEFGMLRSGWEAPRHDGENILGKGVWMPQERLTCDPAGHRDSFPAVFGLASPDLWGCFWPSVLLSWVLLAGQGLPPLSHRPHWWSLFTQTPFLIHHPLGSRTNAMLLFIPVGCNIRNAMIWFPFPSDVTLVRGENVLVVGTSYFFFLCNKWPLDWI